MREAVPHHNGCAPPGEMGPTHGARCIRSSADSATSQGGLLAWYVSHQSNSVSGSTTPACQLVIAAASVGRSSRPSSTSSAAASTGGNTANGPIVAQPLAADRILVLGQVEIQLRPQPTQPYHFREQRLRIGQQGFEVHRVVQRIGATAAAQHRVHQDDFGRLDDDVLLGQPAERGEQPPAACFPL